MSIPRAVWNCPTCGFETDFPKSPHICLLKNCPHPTRRGLPVSYDDEVTPEQIEKINKALAPEFAKGDWQTVESE